MEEAKPAYDVSGVVFSPVVARESGGSAEKRYTKGLAVIDTWYTLCYVVWTVHVARACPQGNSSRADHSTSSMQIRMATTSVARASSWGCA